MFLFSPNGPATTVTSSNQYNYAIQTANPQDNLTQNRYTETIVHEFFMEYSWFSSDLRRNHGLYHYSSQFQSVSVSDAADLKNNLTQTRSTEISNPTEIGILIMCLGHHIKDGGSTISALYQSMPFFHKASPDRPLDCTLALYTLLYTSLDSRLSPKKDCKHQKLCGGLGTRLALYHY